MSNTYKYLLLIGVGVLSGFASISAVFLEDFIEHNIPFAQVFVLLAPAILYGLVTGMYFIYAGPSTRKFIRLLAWIFGSSLSYLLAIQASFLPIGVIGGGMTNALFGLCLAVGGAVGALILWLSFFTFTKKLPRKSLIATIVVGATIPFLVNYFLPILDSYSSPSDFAMMVLFVVWQTAVTVVLGRNLFVSESPELVMQ